MISVDLRYNTSSGTGALGFVLSRPVGSGLSKLKKNKSGVVQVYHAYAMASREPVTPRSSIPRHTKKSHNHILIKLLAYPSPGQSCTVAPSPLRCKLFEE